MTLIILFIAMTAAVLALLLGPLLREHQAPKRVAFDLQIYEDQLLELERDQASGLIDSDQAEAARVEIKRRMLAASDKQHESTREVAGIMKSTAVPVALAFVVPVFCSTLYLLLGSPAMPSSPLSTRTANATEPAGAQPTMPTGPVAGAFQPSAEQRAEIQALPQAEQDQRINAMVDGLEQRLLTSTPNDLDGWMMLGRSRNVLGDPAAAGAAYQRALALLSPDDPRRGDIEANLAAVGGETAPAPETPVTEPAVAPTASTTTPSPAFQPSEEQRAAIQALPQEQQNDTIRAMVDGLTDRLEKNPDDLNGWMMLARSRTVLGESDAADAAYRRVLTLLDPNDPRRADIEASIKGAKTEKN